MRDFMMESADESSGLLSGGRNWLSYSETSANCDRLTMSDVAKVVGATREDVGVS